MSPLFFFFLFYRFVVSAVFFFFCTVLLVFLFLTFFLSQDLVMQYEVQVRDGAKCGGAYVKVWSHLQQSYEGASPTHHQRKLLIVPCS